MTRRSNGCAPFIALLAAAGLSAFHAPAALTHSRDPKLGVANRGSPPSQVKPVEARSQRARILLEGAVFSDPPSFLRMFSRCLTGKQMRTPGLKAEPRLASPSTATFTPSLRTKTADGSLRGFRRMRAVRADFESLFMTLATNNRVRILGRPRLLLTNAQPSLFFVDLPKDCYPPAAAAGQRSQPEVCVLELTASIKKKHLLRIDVGQENRQGKWVLEGAYIMGGPPIPVYGVEVSGGPLASRPVGSAAHLVIPEDEIVILSGFVQTFRQPRFSKVPILKHLFRLGPVARLAARRTRHKVVVLLRPSILEAKGAPVVIHPHPN